jgi:hypothetical protein
MIELPERAVADGNFPFATARFLFGNRTDVLLEVMVYYLFTIIHLRTIL